MRRLLTLLVFLLLSFPAFAQVAPVPTLMNFQGRLTKPDGTPVADGTYSLRFSLWDKLSGGTEKWNQTIANVTVRGGAFGALLNANTANLFNNNLWLEIKIGVNTPLTPRQQLVSVAYAMKANTVPDGSITNDKIAGVDWSKILNAPSSGLFLPYTGTADTSGIAFQVTNPDSYLFSYAIQGNHPSGGAGYLGGGAYGVLGLNSGLSGIGVEGYHSESGRYGYLGGKSYAVYGDSNVDFGSGNFLDVGGYFGGTDYGTYGSYKEHYVGGGLNIDIASYGGLGNQYYGVYGNSNSYGIGADNSASGSQGVMAGPDYGAYGRSSVYGVYGTGVYAVWGKQINNGNLGVLGGADYGVFGQAYTASGNGAYFINAAGGNALRADGPVQINGKVQVTVLEILGGADLAERFDVKGKVTPGMVVEIDPESEGGLRLSTSAYNKRVAGVVSGAKNLSAGVVLTDPNAKASNAQPIAMSGRVWVWCDATEKAIEPGDQLTTAERPGHAMAVGDPSKAQGTILGKAMTRLEKGKIGLVLALVNLQ